MRLVPLFLTCLALAGSIGAAQVAAEDTPGSGMRVKVREGSLSVDLGDGVPLGEVLRAIAGQAGFRLTTSGNLGNVQAQAFTNIPVERGIARLVGNHSLLMIHDAFARSQTVVRVYEAYHRQQGAIKPPPSPTPNVFSFQPTLH